MNTQQFVIPMTVCIVTMLLPGMARAGIVTPISSNRVVTALNRETLPQTQASFTGPTVGAWQATAQVSNLNFSDPNFNPNGALVVVTSSQQSSFASTGVTFSGFVLIDYSFASLPQLGTSATNRCDTVFHVEGNSDYQFQATYSGQDFFNETMGTVFLRNNSTAQTLFSISASDMRSGTFPTGDYTLSILISGGTSGSQIADARTQIDATFLIPAPATGLCILLAPLSLASRRRRPVFVSNPYPALPTNAAFVGKRFSAAARAHVPRGTHVILVPWSKPAMKLILISMSVCIVTMLLPDEVATAGVVTPISSNRVVTALNRETLPQTQASFTGPTVGAWQATAQVSNVNFSDPNFNPNGALVVVTSSQQSSFASTGVTFSGFVFIDYSFASLPQLGTSATNRCDTVFHVEGNSDYQFQATFVANSVAQFANTIFLHNNAGGANLFSLSASGASSGTLATGDYTLSILIVGGSSGSQTADVRSRIDAAFTIPAPATGLCILLAPLSLASRRRRPVFVSNPYPALPTSAAFIGKRFSAASNRSIRRRAGVVRLANQSRAA